MQSDPRGIILDFSDPARLVAEQTGVAIPNYPYGALFLNHSYGYVGGNPVVYTDATGEWGLPGAAIGIGWDIGWQMIIEGKNWRCVDFASVLTSGITGAITPGWMTLGRTANRTRSAVRTLKDQLSKTQSSARKSKIEARIKRNISNLKGEVVIQGIFTSTKKLMQSATDSKPWTIGDDCECRQ